MLSHARDPSPDRKCKLRIEKYVHTVHTQGPTHTGASASEASKQQPAREREEKWRNEMNIKKKLQHKNQKQSSRKQVEMNECEWFIQTALTWLSQHYVVDCVLCSQAKNSSSVALVCLEKEFSVQQIFLNMISHLNNTRGGGGRGGEGENQQASADLSSRGDSSARRTEYECKSEREQEKKLEDSRRGR